MKANSKLNQFSRSKKIISFSLWGDNPKYCQGAIKNAELAKLIYPGWDLLFFLGPDVPTGIISDLEARSNVTLVKCTTPGGHYYALKRFEVFKYTDADISLFRDADSRLSKREAAAVMEWLDSGVEVHIMRDHPNHLDPILAGMWGITRRMVLDLSSLVIQYIRDNGFEGAEHLIPYGFDQRFLADIMYPRVKNKSIIHDEFHGGMPFPAPRFGLNFVGQVFDENDYTNLFHLEKLHEYLLKSQISGFAGIPVRLRNRIKRLISDSKLFLNKA